MAVVDIYSKRQKRFRGELPDKYTYTDLPHGLRVQIVFILNGTLGNESEYWNSRPGEYGPRNSYDRIVNILCEEYGRPYLLNSNNTNSHSELIEYFLWEHQIDKCLDVIELSFWLIHVHSRDKNYLNRGNAKQLANSAIETLNYRFKEHGVGFQYVNEKIIRIDSELIHAEVVEPVLKLLHQQEFEGVQQEFLSAHGHFRDGNYKEALNDCLKSFESTMKVICDGKDWNYNPSAGAKDLIDTCIEHNLIPSFWNHNITSLRCLLESGIPTARNKMSGHGQGSQKIEVPEHYVAYVLHMTASTILFLVQSSKQCNSSM